MKIRLFIITPSEHLMNLDDILVKTEIKLIICFIYFDRTDNLFVRVERITINEKCF